MKIIYRKFFGLCFVIYLLSAGLPSAIVGADGREKPDDPVKAPVFYENNLGKPSILIGTKYKGKPVEQGFWRPLSGAVDSKGNIYILDNGDGRVVVYAPDGKFLRSWGSFGQGPGEFELLSTSCAIFIDHNDLVYVMTRRKLLVQIFTKEGKYLRQFNVKGFPASIAVDKEGKIYICNAILHSSAFLISVYNIKGKLLSEFGKPYLDKPELIKAGLSTRGGLCKAHMDQDKDGNLYVIFQALPVIQKYSPSGNLIWERIFEVEKLKGLHKGLYKRYLGAILKVKEKMKQYQSTYSSELRNHLFFPSMKVLDNSIFAVLNMHFTILRFDFDGRLLAAHYIDREIMLDSDMGADGWPKLIADRVNGRMFLHTINSTYIVGIPVKRFFQK